MSNDAELERELAALTHWPGPATELWRRAFEQSPQIAENAGSEGKSRDKLRRWKRVAPGLAVFGFAAACLLLVLVPSLRYARSIPEAHIQMPSAAHVYSNDNAEAFFGGRFGVQSLGYAGAGVEGSGRGGFAGEDKSKSAPTSIQARMPAADSSAPSGERQVVRKATVELRTPDVRAVFLKAALLISEARGEYVQESGLTGGSERLEANLTLRVAAERLSDVLQQLRELGTVAMETAGGEDVTTQVVDLEARLRNERRVEQELLQLLETRKDAPLKEILELRQAIGSVREAIERMTGERERLGRLVSLATILVIIRTPTAVFTPQPQGLGEYLWATISRAGERGVRALIDTLGGLIFVSVGGGIWIAIAGLLGVSIWRAYRPRA